MLWLICLCILGAMWPNILVAYDWVWYDYRNLIACSHEGYNEEY